MTHVRPDSLLLLSFRAESVAFYSLSAPAAAGAASRKRQASEKGDNAAEGSSKRRRQDSNDASKAEESKYDEHTLTNFDCLVFGELDAAAARASKRFGFCTAAEAA
jgi:hypothetical protein